MTDQELAQRRAKLKRRAPKIMTKAHLDKIMLTFPEDHRTAILDEIKPFLDLKG
jgi:hypothetical protein